jgi:hypothetical protein
MLSNNAPLVVVAQGNAGVPDAVTVSVPTLLGSTEDEDFVDNHEMLTGNNDQYTLSKQMVHHCGGAILSVHWTACKAVLAFHAGSGMSKLKTTTKKDKEAACLELYYNTIELLDEEHFDKEACDFFAIPFRKRKSPCRHTRSTGTTLTPVQRFATKSSHTFPGNWSP